MRDLFHMAPRDWMTMRRILTLAAAAMLSATARSAGDAGGFAKPPPAALKALKASVGKSFSSGWVFVEGSYLKPPYKVERWGNAIRVNGVQVTGEVVPWEEFVKTQHGATAVKKVEPAAEPAAAPAAEPEPEELASDIDDSEATLDDLFNDDPAPKKKKPKPRAAPRRVRRPAVTVTYSFDGEFAHNEKTKGYVSRINAERTRIDRTLRLGGCFFFGSRYSTVSGDSGSASNLVPKLAELMKTSSSREAFASAAASAGLNYLPPQLLDDLYRNRIGYVAIEGRLREEADRAKWSSLLGGR